MTNDCTLQFQKVKALSGQRVVQVACGSRDAQTLALTDEGLVYSWGDGDFGKLGRGGSEGCAIPQVCNKNIDTAITIRHQIKVARWKNLIPSFPWIAPGWRAWGRNPRKGRD